MPAKQFLFFAIAFACAPFARAQDAKTDSAAAATTLKSLLAVCSQVDFADPETTTLGTFYKAASYIVYRGSDKARAWKVFANYKNVEEKKGVDEICLRINGSVNQDSSYKIIKYFTEKESEGIWHVLVVSYIKKGVEKKAAFAFLKIGNKFGLGDID